VYGSEFPEDSEGLDAFRRAGGAVVMSIGSRPDPFSAFDVVRRHAWVGLSSLLSFFKPLNPELIDPAHHGVPAILRAAAAVPAYMWGFCGQRRRYVRAAMNGTGRAFWVALAQFLHDCLREREDCTAPPAVPS
jgi:hypothetical protein